MTQRPLSGTVTTDPFLVCPTQGLFRRSSPARRSALCLAQTLTYLTTSSRPTTTAVRSHGFTRSTVAKSCRRLPKVRLQRSSRIMLTLLNTISESYGLLARYPSRGNHQCVCDVFEIQVNNINYYYYQNVSNIIIIYFKHITHTLVIITHYTCIHGLRNNS